ncbi:MAG: hypothetical protein ACREM8_01355 [Vulcanimicrobiaceae bacterium]
MTPLHPRLRSLPLPRSGPLALGLALLIAAAHAPLRADPAPPGPLAYNDPGMHFQAPDGWQRVSLPAQTGSGESQDADTAAPPAAIFVWHRGRIDQREIVISIDDFDGSLDAFEVQQEEKLRQNGSGIFIKSRVKTQLANGMPAYFLEVNQGDQLGSYVTRDEYLMIDGKRSIDVAYIGPTGDFGPDVAKAALASLYVVAYPTQPQ